MRVLINTIPFYGKGEGVRTYTTHFLRALHGTNADMEWHIFLRRADLEELGLTSDPRFRLPRLDGLTRPPRVPGLRFVSRNAIDQLVMPLHAWRYDVVHYLDTYGPLVAPASAALVLTVHDLFPLTAGQHYDPWVRHYLARLMRASIPHASAIMAISSATARSLTQVLGIPVDRIHVVPNGVDRHFQPASREECGRVAEQYALAVPYIIAVGTIEPRKNLARVIRAFAHAKRAYQLPHTLLIVGKYGWGYQDVMAAIAEADMGDAIRMLGYAPRDDIPPLLAGAEAQVHASIEEGFGLPVVEGMACGVPVITSAGSALAEIAGDAGCLVDPMDEGAIGQALAQVCQDAALRMRMRQAGVERARLYTWERVADAAIEVYLSAGQRRKRIMVKTSSVAP
jgi:glycosyltransferase involved in cell wall biosynthesis